jgi:RNA polymerase sigma factor FliA
MGTQYWRKALKPTNDQSDLVLGHLRERDSVGELIAKYGELVDRIARYMILRMPASVDVNDLTQSGMIGLIEASHSFDASQGASFETYASIRIRGSMLDGIRESDWVPRSVHRRLRALTEATRAMEQESGRAAKSSEVAAAMNVPIADFERQLTDSLRGHVLSIDEYTDREDGSRIYGEKGAALEFADQSKSPAEFLDDSAFRRELVDAIQNLPKREKLVLSLYYEQELDLREIAHVLAVSNSRICQMRSQAMNRIRARLHGWNPSTNADFRPCSPKRPTT